MADMNYWNELQQRRGAVAALEALRANITLLADEIDGSDRVLRIVREHIEKYSK